MRTPRPRFAYSLFLVCFVGMVACGQQVNTATAALAVDASPSEVVGLGPTFADIYTDTLTEATVQGLPGRRYLLMAGEYRANWLHFVPELTVDIAFASAHRIVVNGFRIGETRYTTAGDGQSVLSWVFDGELWPVGARGAIQAFIEDSTTPFGIRSSGTCQVNLNPGFTELTLTDSGNGRIQLADGFQFPFYGTVYDSFYVRADGFVGFELPGSAAPGVTVFHSDVPGIAGLFMDLDPSIGNDDTRITARQFLQDGEWRAKVAFEFVPERNNPNVVHAFDVVLHASGVIDIHWPAANFPPTLGAVVGLTAGHSTDVRSPPIDFSATLLSFTSFYNYQTIHETFSPATNPFDLNDHSVRFYPDFVNPVPLSYSVY